MPAKAAISPLIQRVENQPAAENQHQSTGSSALFLTFAHLAAPPGEIVSADRSEGTNPPDALLRVRLESRANTQQCRRDACRWNKWHRARFARS